MNKNQTLIEELFPNKNCSFYMGDNDQLMNNDKKRENNSSERRSSFKKSNNVSYRTENNSTGKRYKSKYLDTNNANSTKKRNR